MNQAEFYRGSDVGNLPYAGSMQAPMSQNLSTGLNTQAAIAQPDLYGTPDVLAGQQAATSMIQNQGLSPELRSLYQQAQGDQNPYLNSIIDTSNHIGTDADHIIQAYCFSNCT